MGLRMERLPQNPCQQPAHAGAGRVVGSRSRNARGGSFDSPPEMCRAAMNTRFQPHLRQYGIGLRPVMMLKP